MDLLSTASATGDRAGLPPQSSGEPIRLLLIEDEASDAELVLAALARAGLQPIARIVDHEAALRRELGQFQPQAVLSDYSMPSFDGTRALRIVRELCPQTPFIFVSGTIGEERAVQALKEGATDYVLKDHLARLPAALEGALTTAREHAALQQAERELRASREQLAKLLAVLPEALWSIDARRGHTTFMSAGALKISGYTPAEFAADRRLWARIVHPADRAGLHELRRSLATGGRIETELRILRKDGALRWVELRGQLAGSGAALRVDGIARDVTESREQRERIARLARIREFIGSVHAAIARMHNRAELYAEFCRVAVEQGGLRSAWLLDCADPAAVRVAAASGTATAAIAGWLEQLNGDPLAARERLGAKLRATSSASAPGAPMPLLGGGSALCLPLRVADSLRAAVVLCAATSEHFDAEETRLLEELTGSLAFALELIDKQDRIAYLAHYDPVSGLPNRVLFHERLTQALANSRDGGPALTLVVAGVERLAEINDAHGRHVGERALRALAQRLELSAGGSLRLAHLGSGQFAQIYHGLRGPHEVGHQIEDLLEAGFAAPLQIEGIELRLAARAGVAVAPEDGDDAATLLRNAEASLARARRSGERYLFYAPAINARVSEQLELERKLRLAVERDELFLHFQPKFALATRSLVGFEALLRWRGADGQPVPPSRFVPLLEETGLIFAAGLRSLAQASATYRDWQAHGRLPVRIAVNLSALQLRRASFAADLRAALGDPADCGVDLELTESLLMDEVETNISKLAEARAMGLKIALDDFGTGYSSLAYLSRLPIDTVKIDRSFIVGMTDNPDHMSIVSTIVSLAHSLEKTVVAEGVETEAQIQLLRLLRCDQVQGYLLGAPLPAEAAARLLATTPT